MEHWFLLRGLVRETAHWGPFYAEFTAAFPNARVSCLDLPGNGIRYRERTPLSVGKMMEALRAQANALARPGERRFVLALSLGGMVAIEWAARHPDELAGIVLGNTSLGGVSPFYQRLQPRAWAPVLKASRERDPARRERALLSVTSTRSELHAQIAVEWAEIHRQRPVQRANALRQVIAAARYRPPRVPPRVPHLVLCGLGDQLVDPECSLAIHRLWRGPLGAHPTAGHDITLDAGPWVIDQIRSWRDALR
jgi:pimeloyl-ACP methyl ester carboxylesterase